MQGIRIDSAGIGQMLKGQEMRSLMRSAGEQVEAIYRGTVARRTGRLAASTRVETFIGGRRNDRWNARVIAEAPYAASHEYGTEKLNNSDELRNALNTWKGA